MHPKGHSPKESRVPECAFDLWWYRAPSAVRSPAVFAAAARKPSTASADVVMLSTRPHVATTSWFLAYFVPPALDVLGTGRALCQSLRLR
jgi:hypothetical protein